MNTQATSDNADLHSARLKLESFMTRVPIATALMELQLVVERISFSGLTQQPDVSTSQRASQLQALFGEDISQDMLAYLLLMNEDNQLDVLGDNNGRAFLEYCIIHYRSVPEISITTAIELTEEFRDHVESVLRPTFSDAARIVFSTAPSIIAGIIIQSGNSVIDKSLRSHVASEIAKSVQMQGLTPSSEDERG